MPRQALTPDLKRKNETKALIVYWQAVRGTSGTEDIARRLKVSAPTARKKLNNPGEMRLDDLWRLQRSLQIPGDEMAKIFFGFN